MSPKPQKQRRGVIDTSVLVAGLAAFRAGATPVHDSAQLIRDWLENDTFVWLINADILDEYKAVLGRLGVRPALIGTIVNLLREEAEVVKSKGSIEADPDPGDAPFWECAEHGHADFIVTMNPRDFPQNRLKAKIIAPGDVLPSVAAAPKMKRTRRARKK